MCQQRSNCDFPVLGGSRRRRVFGPEVGLPLLTGGSDLRNLWRPGGWHSAAENPIQLQEKKKTAVGLHENRVTWLETSAWAANLSWLFIHTQSFQPVQFHPSLHVSPLLFPFLQTHRRYLINQFFFSFCFLFYRNQWIPASRTASPSQSPRQLLGHPQAALFPPLFTRF